MAWRIIALSGRICSGKSKLVAGLGSRFGVVAVSTRQVAITLTGCENTRPALQAAGKRLDRETRHEWVARAAAGAARENAVGAILLVDAVRSKQQVDALRRGFAHRVVQVHLTAPDEVLELRYKERGDEKRDGRAFAEASEDPIERRVRGLARHADVTIDTSLNTAKDVVTRVAARLGLFGSGVRPLVDVLVGGQYGSEGKGQVSAYLAPEYDLIVRVGGPNAGHQVYGEPKRTFYHLPSGTERNEEARLLLGPGAVIWLPKLEEEIRLSRVTPDRLFIDERAMLIDKKDIEFEETHLRDKIGSTAQGVGAATSRKILRTAADPPVRLAGCESRLREYTCETAEVLEEAYAREQRIFLEGTQGTALSIHHGNYPYTTSRDTTIAGCLADAGIAPSRVRRMLMVCRSHPIRVESPKGETSGPMSREISAQDLAERCDHSAEQLVEAERTSTTGRLRRFGEFDWNLFRRSTLLNGPTDIALSFADYVGRGNDRARRYEQLNRKTIEFIEEMERVGQAPVSLIAVRFHYRAFIDRRNW